jgi:hypothetical protein
VSDPTHPFLIRWTANANRAFQNSLAHIESEDTGAAHLVFQRVEKSILLLSIQPGMGTLTARPGVRRYAVTPFRKLATQLITGLFTTNCEFCDGIDKGNGKNYRFKPDLKPVARTTEQFLTNF